eukprot:TRINITY_DN3197_c0_g1_i1.p1 TRINITY_DN3197_c0_g1~~TRINITY_DN3197_c0_g1_i1.p1  ORF type:complete len:280 (+),score=25.83 TRINITY_DN3197_c0_g1_i1:66-905(+)
MMKWERWSGNHTFYLEGRLITAANDRNGSFYWTLLAQITPFLIIFFTFDQVTYIGSHYWMYYLIIITYSYMLFLFFYIGFSDPGFVERHQDFLQRENVSSDIEPSIVNLNGALIECNYCHTCHHFKLPRMHHCSHCDTCVHGFDHHCPWVGNCIAERNYRWYVVFLTLAIFNLVVPFVLGIIHLIELYTLYTIAEIIVNHPATILLVILTFGLIGPVGVLTGFHYYIISTNQNTRESWKKIFPERNPFYIGCAENWKNVLCGRKFPQSVDFRSPDIIGV